MKKILALLISVFQICSFVPIIYADSLLITSEPKDSAAFYTIGKSEKTFSGVYSRMHLYLDLNTFPIPEPDTSNYSYVTGQHDEFYVLRDDDDSYDYIGYVCNPDGTRVYIIWSWAGYHKDGNLIGVDSYYTLGGVYLGNIQRDYSTGAALSSRNSPFYLNTGSLYGKE